MTLVTERLPLSSRPAKPDPLIYPLDVIRFCPGLDAQLAMPPMTGALGAIPLRWRSNSSVSVENGSTRRMHARVSGRAPDAASSMVVIFSMCTLGGFATSKLADGLSSTSWVFPIMAAAVHPMKWVVCVASWRPLKTCSAVFGLSGLMKAIARSNAFLLPICLIRSSTIWSACVSSESAYMKFMRPRIVPLKARARFPVS